MPQITRQSAKPVTKPATSVNGRSAWNLIDKLRMLLYGESATGKTTIWSSFPGPILALVCSGGNKPGELRTIDTPEFRKKIDARIVESTEQARADLAEAAGGRFATVVLDHATGFQDIVLKELMGWDATTTQRPILGGNKQIWSEVAVRSKDFLRDLLSLPCHVVVVAQQRTFGGEEESDLIKPSVSAALTPAVEGWLRPACDYMFQTYLRPKMVERVKRMENGKEIRTMERARGVEYCLRTEPHDVYRTKLRRSLRSEIPECIVDANFDKIMAVIRGV